MTVRFSGVKMTYQGNVMYCARYKDAQENIDICVKAMCELTGLDEDVLFGRVPFEGSLFEQNGGKIEYYIARG